MYESTYECKKDALTEIFDIENFSKIWPSKKVTISNFLEVISKNTYNLKDDLGITAATTSRIVSSLLPEKPKDNAKICTYLLVKYGLKPCASCHRVFTLENFHNNVNKTYGKDSYCIPCFNDFVRSMRKEYQARKKANKLQRTPAWANLDKIAEIYANCPEGYHVDHIIPLQGELVSGLHVENNLQYLSALENIQKSNKFIPE
jgi:hypothetical protein